VTDLERIMADGCSPDDTEKMGRRIRWAHENMGNPLLGAEAEIEALEARVKALEDAAIAVLDLPYPGANGPDSDYFATRRALNKLLEKP
jgi:hypothetical protein